MAEISDAFFQWLHQKLEDTHLSQSEASRRAGLNQNAISDIINGKTRSITVKTAKGLERVFGTNAEEILRMAGALPDLSGSEQDITFRDLWAVVRSLTVEEREEVLEYAMLRRKLQKKRTPPDKPAGGPAR